jgi:phosphoribosylformimino-5-aminoimidazole carboxamide ribotide isomerase
MEIYLTIGIDRLILGSAAVSDPDLVEQAIARFGSNRIAVGIDTRAGKVATNGWLTTSQQTANALLTAMQQRGVTTFIVTDIAKDGMMQGPNAQLLADLQQAMPQATIIASGGVSSLADLRRLQTAGIQAAIIGKAWQTGAIELAMLKQMEG